MTLPLLLLFLGIGALALLLLVGFAPLISGMLATFCFVVGRLAHAFAEVAEQITDGARRVLDAILPLDLPPISAEQAPRETPETRVWTGMVVVSRLVALVPSLCIFLGDYTLATLRSTAVQTGGEGAGAPPLPAGVASGLLWLSVATLWGILLLELLRAIPPETHLFSRLSPRLHMIGIVVTLIGAGLTVGSFGLLYLIAQLLVDGYTWPLGGEILSAVQGVLLASITVVAAWALVWGIVALISVVCATVQIIFALLALLLHLLERAAPEVARLQQSVIGAISASGRSLVGLPQPAEERPLTLSTASLSTASFASSPTLLGPGQQERRQDNRGGTHDTHASHGPEEDSMSDDCLSYRTTTLVGIDRKGATFLPLLRAAIDVVGATALLRAQGICDISRLSDAPCTTAARSGVPDLSTTQDEVRAAHAAPGGAHMPQKVAERVIAALVDRVVEISLPEALGERNVLWIQDMRTIATSVSGLRDLSRRLPHHTITVLGFPPAPDLRDEQFKHAYAHLITLREQGVIATTIVPDIRSPLVLRVGEEVQEVLLAQALAHGLVGHLHDDRNPSFAEQMVRLGARSPFVAAALGSTRVVSAAAQRERWYEAVRRILRRHANGHEGHGQGALVDARSQARDLTRLLLHDETLRTVGAPLDVDTPPLFLSYSVPIRLDDTRIRAFAGDLRPWLASTYPSSIASIVQGQVKRVQGRTNGKIGTAQMMYGACWYGIGPLAWARPELESLGVDGDDGDQRESRDETAPERERESAHKSGGQDGKESTGKGED